MKGAKFQTILNGLSVSHKSDFDTGTIMYRSKRVSAADLSPTTIEKLWRLANRALIKRRVSEQIRNLLGGHVRSGAIQETINALASYEYAVNWLENHKCLSMTTEERDALLIVVKHLKSDLIRLDHYKLSFEHLTV